MPGHGRTVTLPPDLADYVEARVSSGAFASAEGGVRAGLGAPQERAPKLEGGLTTELGDPSEAVGADPHQGIPPGAVLDELRRRWAEGRASGPARPVDIEALTEGERRRHAGSG